MLNNSSDQTRKKLYDEYEESLFRLVMSDVAEKEGRLLLEENEELKNDPEYMPTADSIKKFSNQLNAHLKKHMPYTKKWPVFKMLNRVAVAMLAVFIVFSTTMLTVHAFRIKVLDFLINIEPKYTSFQLEDNNSASSGGMVVNWTNSYVPTYIPEGYEVSSISNSDSFKKLAFQNKQNKDLIIIYSEYNLSNSVVVDTENASLVETVKINGFNGTLVEKNSMVTVTWETDSHMFVIQTQISPTESIKMAEGVKFIK